MRIVLYAEGPGEAPTKGLPPKPRMPLSAAHLGPAHVLIKRILEPTEVVFEAPLRPRGRVLLGSDLLNTTLVQRALTWARVDDRPDLAIILVDEDGRPDRRATIESAIANRPVATVVGVAVREFESWLLADTTAVAAATSKNPSPPPNVEKMKPGEAKAKLAEHCAGHDGFAIRTTIAETADLDRLRKLRSFEAFSKALLTSTRP